jgi:hypothetical protein
MYHDNVCTGRKLITSLVAITMAESLGTQILYPKKSSAVWLLLGCSAFVAAGVWMGNKEGWMGYAAAAFFALGIPVALLQLLPGSSYLQIDDTGLTFSSLFRKTSVRWSDVDEFFVVTLRQSGLSVLKMVGFNYVSSYDRLRIGRRFAAAIAKCEGALPDTYGKGAEELAVLLNSYHQMAKARRGEPSTAADVSWDDGQP